MTRTAVNVFLVVYLALQLILPLRRLLQSETETPGDFSWNMYTGTYHCRIFYGRRDQDGELHKIDVGRFFPKRSRLMDVTSRDRLPRFHRWLCAQLREGERAVITSDVVCSYNGRPAVRLTAKGADICSVTNAGVIRP